MSSLARPERFLPPLSPRIRPPSPNMSPGGRRGRGNASSDEARLRDLSPSDTLRAFSEETIPFDTTCEEYKVFACIESLTVADKDLGSRVAKAAQRLKSWCQEIEEWTWNGSFEPPSAEQRAMQRRNIMACVQEHAGKGNADVLAPLEYWGPLLSVEVQAHEARLDEIADELVQLEMDELKEFVLDMYGPNRSRPSSAGYAATRANYTPLDDFSFLITQTLISSLPFHTKIKEHLGTWTARVSVLRQVPGYLRDLASAQKAVRLGWDAIEPPTDDSDLAFGKWREAMYTIDGVLQAKVSDLGRCLDVMLDTLEGRQDCLPDDWIDTFENVERDFQKWIQTSRKRLIDFDVSRRHEQNRAEGPTQGIAQHFKGIPQDPPSTAPSAVAPSLPANATAVDVRPRSANTDDVRPRSATAFKVGITGNISGVPPWRVDINFEAPGDIRELEPPIDHSDFEDGDTVLHHDASDGSNESDNPFVHSPTHPTSPLAQTRTASPVTSAHKEKSERATAVLPESPRPETPRPETPRHRRGSTASITTPSSTSSPTSAVEESPSVRRATTLSKPPLNAKITKRRPLPTITDSALNAQPPWPPTQFSTPSPPPQESLDQKIEGIINSISAPIRLASNPTSTRSTRPKLANKTSSRYLRTASSRTILRSTPSRSNLHTSDNELILSPAKPSSEPSSSTTNSKSSNRKPRSAENDIQLYHLSQPGRTQPIKLYIRRIGENGERVMVRVGGGWADLGEYLRQYAEHHGRRTISEGKFEIVGLGEKEKKETTPRPESSMSVRSVRRERRTSGYGGTRPESAMSVRSTKSRQSTQRRMSGSTNAGSRNTTPQKPTSVGLGIDTDVAPPVPNFPSAFTPTTANTPASAIDTASASSAPSTDTSARSWRGNEVGLAGPKARKLELSEQKLEWVEGMMKAAKGVVGKGGGQGHLEVEREGGRPGSRNGNGGGKKEGFGNLGAVGGTKRVFLRGGALGGE
ncbi:hypothetical protein M011DRAFT_466110 [Sporormia fimetaria CBS 119925]|uniref:GAR domain-containing protein n=1 Tax=Sporormia fimetaria CBS 119925 TaxID=1340428 RepID=A0A6A6VIE1_9PLEO|nr:hypothetical protein M011DRAFT_466110 [Sporormia fimetaria CBS 119925]